MFDLQPTLQGDLLTLRPLQPQDFPALYAVGSDPLIWEQHPERDRWREEVFRVYFDEGIASGGALLALDRASGQAIGSSRYFRHDPVKREIEIGWTFLARAYWGGRYNGEMKRLMIEHAFRWVDRVLFLIGPVNFRSQRAVEKIGGVREGVAIDPKRRERLVFVITPERFARFQKFLSLGIKMESSADGKAFGILGAGGRPRTDGK